MYDTVFVPEKTGKYLRVLRHCEGTTPNKERALIVPQGALAPSIRDTFVCDQAEAKVRQSQDYPIRGLKQRCGLSRSYEGLIAARFRRGGM